MRNHDFRFGRNFFAPVPIVQISDEPLGRTTDVEEIHRVCADARKFRPLCNHGAVRHVATLRFRHDFSDGTAAKTARSKCERLVKAII